MSTNDRSMNEYRDIRYEVSDPVAVITMNRPEAMNAWTDNMGREIRDAVERAAADRSVFGIIITGEGRAFCAGADMNLLTSLSGASGAGAGTVDVDADALAGGSAVVEPETDDEFGGRFAYLMAIDKPVIAAVNGAVAGMAYPFALCCDLRVVSPDALFLTAFAQRGLIAEWGISWLLPRLVGPSVALDLLLSSRRVKGQEALDLGLANYLVEGDELLAFCRTYIEQMAAACSPSSVAIMKKQVYRELHRGMAAAEADAQRLMLESFNRPDFAEGVQSFVEKRPPAFNRLPL